MKTSGVTKMYFITANTLLSVLSKSYFDILNHVLKPVYPFEEID